MTKKFKILGKFIKDMSSETKDAETYLFVKDNISKYQLDININSKALKNKMVEVNTIMKYQDKNENKNKSYIGEDNLKLFFNINKQADLLVNCFDIKDEFLGEYNLGNIF